MEGQQLKGKVKWFNAKKGFGFIESEDGQDIFVHYSAIVQGGYRSLEEGDEVEFEIEDGPKGQRARNVKRLTTKYSNIQRNA